MIAYSVPAFAGDCGCAASGECNTCGISGGCGWGHCAPHPCCGSCCGGGWGMPGCGCDKAHLWDGFCGKSCGGGGDCDRGSGCRLRSWPCAAPSCALCSSSDFCFWRHRSCGAAGGCASCAGDSGSVSEPAGAVETTDPAPKPTPAHAPSPSDKPKEKNASRPLFMYQPMGR